MKPEFNKGDTVNWQTHEGAFILAKVKRASFDRSSTCGKRLKLSYHLEGISAPLLTISGPRFIAESRFFIDGYDADKWDKKTRTLKA